MNPRIYVIRRTVRISANVEVSLAVRFEREMASRQIRAFKDGDRPPSKSALISEALEYWLDVVQ